MILGWIGVPMSNAAAQAITQAANRYGLDPRAMMAIAYNESSLNPGSIGDGGTSYGLFQLHQGGALGNMSTSQARQYLDPFQNAMFAARQMAGDGIRGLHGQQAIQAMSQRFERPANVQGEVQNALNWYNHNAGQTGNVGNIGSSFQSAQAGNSSAPLGKAGMLQYLKSQESDLLSGGWGLPQPTKLLATLNNAGGGSIPVVADHNGPVSSNAPPIVSQAEHYLGQAYKWGGSNPQTGFDCSGFVQWLYGQHGISLPRTTYEQINVGQHVGINQLRPGDIVFFDQTAQGPGHEGMFIGNGQFIHAPHTGDVIKISSLSDPYYRQHFVAGRRVA